MNLRALPALALALAAPSLLGGCAAALVPVVAGGVMAKKQIEGGNRDAGANRQDAAPGAELALPPAERIPVFTSGPAATSAPGTNAALMAPTQPAPAAAMPPSAAPTAPETGTDPYAAFARHAAQMGQAARPGLARSSALIDQDSLTSRPRLLECEAQPPAALIDLDPGDQPFDLADPPLAAPGLGERLAALRAAGVTVLWSASLPVTAAESLYTILQATGLDPQRTDRLLLLKPGQERKQQRREAAARDWCIVAIAGDRRADFDEAFDYLRDPQGPVAQALEPHFGAGWFLAPPPID